MSPSLLSLKELRRRSRASFRTNRSTDTSSDGAVSQHTAPSSGSLTPPSIAHRSDSALHLQLMDATVPPTPAHPSQGSPALVPGPIPPALPSSRHSVLAFPASASTIGKKGPPLSPYAPRVHNVSENAWVYQKAILISGKIGEQDQVPLDGTLTVTKLDDSFPPISWPVCEAHFKALVYLQPGANRIRLEFSSPKLANASGPNSIHVSHLTLHMMPTLGSPPLQLAILLAKDSPATFDAVPARAEREGNGLQTAIKKFRMAAYLWQAYTAEQMARQKLGRRTFRFEEEWTTGTVNHRDRESGEMRSEAKVHVIWSDKTVEELRDLNKAQQYEKGTDRGALFNIAIDALKKHFHPLAGQKQYVAVLLLDAQWDKDVNVIRGHAALGGGTGDLQLGIFGSHCLQSYPSCFEEVVPAFTDCTPTDTTYVANDSNDAGSSWEAANIGIGAHLHEVGHLFGCPHQESGIMLRDYVVLNRSFVTREAYSTRTKFKGGRVLQSDECSWHRLDCLRFRAHPAFKLPNDVPLHPDESVQAYAVDGGNVLVVAATGISFVEIFGEGDDVCRSWIEFTLDNNPVQRQITLAESDLRARLPDSKRKGRVRVSIKSHGGGCLDLEDFKAFSSKASSIKLPGGKVAFRSQSLGESKMEGSTAQETIFASAVKYDRVLSRIIVYHGSALDGLEFLYDDNSSQLFGHKGGKEGGDLFELDVRRGEYLSGFIVRAGFWIDGLQILTSLGRRSPMFGNAHGGSAYTLVPPRGYTICGVAGTCGAWLDGFSVLIKR